MPPRPVSRQSHQGGGPMNPFCQPPALPLVERSQPPTKASNRRLNAIDGPTMINRLERSVPCPTVSSAWRGPALM